MLLLCCYMLFNTNRCAFTFVFRTTEQDMKVKVAEVLFMDPKKTLFQL